jgi:hypothetical protein
MPDSAGNLTRKIIATRRTGIGNKCVCGENRPPALNAGSHPTKCEECRRRSKGRTIYDYHHIAGSSNHLLVVPIPVNDHRAVLNAAQYEWPKATRENPDASPLLAIAACIRGFIDALKYLMDELLVGNAERLETLDAFFVAHLGPRYWSSLILETKKKGKHEN